MLLYVNGPTPDVTNTSISPESPPLQSTSVFTVSKSTASGFVIVTLDVDVHPLASVTVTLYVPASSPVTKALSLSGSSAPSLLQSYEKAPVPPDAVTSACPSESP